MSEKPLHVRVAEALGCHATLSYTDHGWHCECHERSHAETGPLFGGLVLRYDTDWSTTGPLIERLGIDVWLDASDHHVWLARRGHFDGPCPEGGGPTPLIAACNLILALHAAGKLRAA